ncbi:MAG TPA: hypothetical protein PKI32_05670 [Opitutales bacterium]|nr:hypothetical protein [Opitutales bacterium]
MNIDPLKGQSSGSIGNVTRRSGNLSTSGRLDTSSSDDSELDLITQQNLLDQVRDMPEVRSEVSAMGRRLAEDPNYPSDEAVEKIATLMADLDPNWMDALDAEEEPSDGQGNG